MPKIDPAQHPLLSHTTYLPPYQAAVAGRSWVAIGTAGGLSQFGANLVTLAPGAWSSQRHWHSAEDELVVMLSGELVLVEDAGETVLGPGDIATFAAAVPDGHHLQNRSTAPATFLAIGTDRPDDDQCHYPDIDQYWSLATGYVPKPR
ncbi:MAG: transcriptional regulator [Alphaproteobacteria bacterium PA4]|nr:MAG: transcriptional regulator [Alphaproteobacteria bacterium PA4]